MNNYESNIQVIPVDEVTDFIDGDLSPRILYFVEKPAITFMEEAAILNKVSLRFLGKPDYVNISWDKDEEQLIVSPSREKGAVPLVKQRELRRCFSPMFYKTMGWDPEQVYTVWGNAFYEPLKGTYLVFDLSMCLLRRH